MPENVISGHSLALQICHQLEITNCPIGKLRDGVIEEVKNFFMTGNCSRLPDNITCVNPTLLEPKTNQWRNLSWACPFDPPFHTFNFNQKTLLLKME